MREFESFMISVDFCSEPVTFNIAKKCFRMDSNSCTTRSPSCCVNCVPIEPKRALLTDNRSFCLSLLTTSLASIRADLTSPLAASCFTVNRALEVAASSCDVDLE